MALVERPDPDALLAGQLGDWLRLQAYTRRNAREKVRNRQVGGVGLACAAAFSIIIDGGAITTALQIGFVIGLGGFGWAEWVRRPVVRSIKGGINGAIARALGLDYSVIVTDQSHFSAAREFGLLPRYDDAALEDQWSGALGGQRFCLHEARLTENRGAGKDRRKVTVFAGCLIAVSFGRPFRGTTLIERKARGGILAGLFGPRDTRKAGGFELQRVDTVDPAFEDLFDVWTNDQVEGHYLVNPAYVERLVAIEQAFKGEKVRALFRMGELLIVLESGNLFESGSLDAGDDRRMVEQSIDQFARLADLAVSLNERPR